MMMLQRLALVLAAQIAIGMTPLVSKGLYVGANDQNATTPFSLLYAQNGNLSFEVVLQVRNESSGSVSVLSWLANLQLQTAAGSQGNLVFEAVGTPVNSLFGADPGPISDIVAPSDHLQATDADVISFTGAAVVPSETRNILELTVAASSDAAGTFELVSIAFDPAMPDQGFSWLESGGFEPLAFENSAPSSVPGYILLGTIEITAPAVGDYTGDGHVNEADFAKWRQDYGSMVVPSGSGADGNSNGVVDAADYVMWREHLGAPGQNAVIVPEPTTLILLLVVVALPQRVASFRRYEGAARE
jgi:hypothetical protein